MYNRILGRPRVVIAANAPEIAVAIISALNPKRYRVEHMLDWNEAILRAELVLAHAIVLHEPELSESFLRRCDQTIDRSISLVFVSESEATLRIARKLQAEVISLPIHRSKVKRTIHQAVAAAYTMRNDPKPSTRRYVSATHPLQKVMILLESEVQSEVFSSVLKSRMRVACSPCYNHEEALGKLDEGFDCCIVQSQSLMLSAQGAYLAQQLAKKGIPVLLLRMPRQADVSAVGQCAWDIMPQLRRVLASRPPSLA